MFDAFSVYQLYGTGSRSVALATTGGTSGSVAGGTFPLDRPVLTVLTWDGANIYVYEDGNLLGSAVCTGTPNYTTSFSRLYAMGSAEDAGAAGIVYYLAMWARFLHPREVAALAVSPWALVAPQSAYITVDMGASGSTNLTVADITQTQTTDDVVLTTSSSLVISETTQSQTSENVVLDASSSTNLVVDETNHGQTIDAVVLQTSSTLQVEDSLANQQSDLVTLVTATSINIAGADQAQNSENVVLDTSNATPLVIQETSHAHLVDNLILLAACTLNVDDSNQTQQTDSVDLSTLHHLLLSDSLHTISSESPTLTIPSGGTGATAEEIATAVVAALNATTIPVDIHKVNTISVTGVGTDGNPWRAA